MSYRNYYDQELFRLEGLVEKMGHMASVALAKAIQVASTLEGTLAEEVIAHDSDIDRMEREIEQLCVTLLLRQQPIASDLRRISTTLKLVTDLERVGDAAADICEIARTLEHNPQDEEFLAMLHQAKAMVDSAVEAYLAQDLEKARQTIALDDVIDGDFDRIKKRLIQQIAQDAGIGDEALDLLMMAKYVERVGDHAVNICEWTICRSTGIYREEQIM
ncbi:phosphate signaling complex protein PhoU [Angelakisella massiliensis]|uniref:phosphate signaling complex protein PhoU n=1 Tax=Angelakisella massiliensis TaxID=1871018 RepID=UPI0023A87406|nr:phosphate signaling complex protein PhoU [Angelakisella massiliensis]